MIWSRAGFLVPEFFFGNMVFLYESNIQAHSAGGIPHALRTPPDRRSFHAKPQKDNDPTYG